MKVEHLSQFNIALPLLWLGMLIGVSFIATPVKFSAPSLDLGSALDVGRVTFALFNKIEWALALLCIISFLIWRPDVFVFLALGLAIVTLAVESAWLLPALSARVVAVLSQAPLPASQHHLYYVLCEVIKFLSLVFISGKLLLAR